MRSRVYRSPVVSVALALWASSGCGFEVSVAAPVDAEVVPDVPPDISVPATPTSCKQIHATDPMRPSGPYTIDPDGAGGDAAVSVTCDMTTDGGGWTIVFFPATPTLDVAPAAYTSSTARMLTDAQTVLLAYRNAVQVAYAGYASFPMPAAWRTTAPFNQPGSDVATTVSVNGTPAAPATLRFGSESFNSGCTDPWITSERFGRICIVGTNAPFFTSFASAFADGCSNSSSAWSSTLCSADLRFSIAVR